MVCFLRIISDVSCSPLPIVQLLCPVTLRDKLLHCTTYNRITALLQILWKGSEKGAMLLDYCLFLLMLWLLSFIFVHDFVLILFFTTFEFHFIIFYSFLYSFIYY